MLFLNNFSIYCSDFRYESNGIFVLGVGFFFLRTKFDFLTSHFWRNFFISFERYCCHELKFEKIFHLWSFFVELWGFKDCHFGHFDQFGTINARYNSRYQRVSGDLIRLINRSKLVERNLFAIIDLLQWTKILFLYFILRVGGWFSQKNSNFRKNFHLIFLCFYCCSINLKRQSEHSGLRPDTSSLVLLASKIVNSNST